MIDPKSVYEPPFTYDKRGQFITDAKKTRVLDVRGYGHLAYLVEGIEEANKLQDAIGYEIAKALNKHWPPMTREQLLKSRTPEDLKSIPVPSEREIKRAIARGAADREHAERASRGIETQRGCSCPDGPFFNCPYCLPTKRTTSTKGE